MGLRFSKRIKLMPGVRLNLGLRGVSLSAGPRGASVTVGKRGIFGNVGLPGTGLSYRTRLDKPSLSSRSRPETPPTIADAPTQFTLRFLGEQVEYLDQDSRSYDVDTVARIKTAFRDELKPVLQDRVTILNAVLDDLLILHRRTPTPLASAAPPVLEPERFSQPKPVRPIDPALHADFASRLSDWQVARAEHGRIAPGSSPDLEAIAQPVLNRLAEIDWPRETNVNIDLDPSGRTLLLAVDLPELDDMPQVQYSLAARDLTIIAKPLSAAAIVRLYAGHVHSVFFRLAGEAFAAEGSINLLRIAGYRQEISTATGCIENVWILSVAISRDQWRALDFDNLGAVDPQAAIERFDLLRNMKIGGGFRPTSVHADFSRLIDHD